VIEDKMLGLTRVTLLFGGLGICRLSGLWPRNGRGKHRGSTAANLAGLAYRAYKSPERQ